MAMGFVKGEGFAFELLDERLGDMLPPGSLPSQEQINATYGPTFGGWAQAMLDALSKVEIKRPTER